MARITRCPFFRSHKRWRTQMHSKAMDGIDCCSAQAHSDWQHINFSSGVYAGHVVMRANQASSLSPPPFLMVEPCPASRHATELDLTP
jgi:hypothetical protein